MKKTQKSEPQTVTHNHTPFSVNQIKSFQYLGRTVDKWRGRNVALYQHPSESDSVVTVGVTFDNSMTVVCVDKKTDWTTALDYAEHGKVYVSE
jgi:hypothetical protein